MSFLTRAFSRAPDPPEIEQRSAISISDPGFAAWFGTQPTLAGVTVTPETAMGLTAVSACVKLISGAIASLPMRTVRTNADGTTVRVNSWLDDPGGPDGPTVFEWLELLACDLLLRGNFFAEKIYGGAGQLLWLTPLPECAVSIDVKNGRKVYTVQLENGRMQEFGDDKILHIPGLSLDGIRGASPITLARQSLGADIAMERAAARLWKSGLLASAIVTPTDPMSPDDATVVRDTLSKIVAGETNAGSIAVLNKNLSVHQWQISPADAQFIESRQFAVSDIARAYLVPPHMIGDASNSTSWGSGLAEQVSGFQKFNLTPWTSRIEARLSRLLPDGQKVEFDYRKLLGGDPKSETELLIMQTGRPILTVNEARAMQNRTPIDGGDVLPASLPNSRQGAA